LFSIIFFTSFAITSIQTFLAVKLGLSLVNIHISGGKLIFISSFSSFITCLIKTHPIFLGLHTLLLIVLLVVLLKYFSNIPPLVSSIAVMFGITIFGVAESILLPFFLELTSHTFNQLSIYPLLYFWGAIPTFVVIFIICLFIKKYHIIFLDLSMNNYWQQL